MVLKTYFWPNIYNDATASDNDLIWRFENGAIFIIQMILNTVVFYYGLAHFHNRRRLRDTIENYDVRKSQLAQEMDRPLLLRHVNELFLQDSLDAAEQSALESSKKLSHVLESGASSMNPKGTSAAVDNNQPRASHQFSEASQKFSVSASNPNEPPQQQEDPTGGVIQQGGSVLNPNQQQQQHEPARRGVDKYFASDGSARGSTNVQQDVSVHSLEIRANEGGDQWPFATVTNEGNQAGIDAFNRAVQSQVVKRLPVVGLKSWKLFAYVPSIIYFAQREILPVFDFWAYNSNDPMSRQAQQFYKASYGFAVVVAFSWKIFVWCPFNIYTLGVVIRMFLSAKDRTGWPWWVFLPFFLGLEVIFNIRDQVLDFTRFIMSGTVAYICGSITKCKKRCKISIKTHRFINFQMNNIN